MSNQRGITIGAVIGTLAVLAVLSAGAFVWSMHVGR